MNGIKQYAPLLGRIFIAQLFIIAGVGKIVGFSQTVAYIGSKGLPLAGLLALLTIIIEVGGGLMILFGWRARLAAIVFFLWMIPVTLLFHNFWSMEGAQAMANQINFQKNVAIMGAMLLIMVFGPGPYSLKKD